jgi:hypothetical protein
MNAKEKERRIRNIRLRAIILKNLVINLKEHGGVDMRDEIIEIFKENSITFDAYCDKHNIKHFREAFFHHLRSMSINEILTEEELNQHFNVFLGGGY